MYMCDVKRKYLKLSEPQNKQTNKQTDRQAKFIYRLGEWIINNLNITFFLLIENV